MTDTMYEDHPWRRWATLLLTLVLFTLWILASTLTGCAELQPFVTAGTQIAGDAGVAKTQRAIQDCEAREPVPATREEREACLREELGDFGGIVDVCEAGAVVNGYLGADETDETGGGDG